MHVLRMYLESQFECEDTSPLSWCTWTHWLICLPLITEMRLHFLSANHLGPSYPVL